MIATEHLANLDAALAGDDPIPVVPEDGQTVQLADGTEVRVSNPTTIEGVEEGLDEVGSTLHADFWSALGMLVGFGLLAVLWKVLRP